MTVQYKKLNRISMTAQALFFILFAVMVGHIAIRYIQLLSNANTSAPALIALMQGIWYVPFLIIFQVVYFEFRRRMKKEFPKLFQENFRLTKQVIIKKIISTTVFTLICCIIFLLVAPFVVIPAIVDQHINYWGTVRKNYPLKDIYKASDYKLNAKERYLQTEDGIRIWTSEVYTRQPKAVFIYLTGIIQPSVTYFYGHSKYMEEQGYASILVEVRGHGKSGGNQIGLGYEEVKDVKAVVKYIKSQDKYKNVPIVLHGVSMGATVAVNAFGQIKDVDALIAMSAYSSFEDVTVDLLDEFHIPDFIQIMEKPLIKYSLKNVFGSKTVDKIKPIEQIKHTNGRPVLLIACTKDTNVPIANIYRLEKVNPKAQIWIRNSWEHFIIKNCDFKNVAKDKEYCNKILTFLEDNVVRK